VSQLYDRGRASMTDKEISCLIQFMDCCCKLILRFQKLSCYPIAVSATQPPLGQYHLRLSHTLDLAMLHLVFSRLPTHLYPEPESAECTRLRQGSTQISYPRLRFCRKYLPSDLTAFEQRKILLLLGDIYALTVIRRIFVILAKLHSN
jgi:hypothetical protein